MDDRRLHQSLRALPVLPGFQQGLGGGQQSPPVSSSSEWSGPGARGSLSSLRLHRVNSRALQILVGVFIASGGLSIDYRLNDRFRPQADIRQRFL